MHFIHRGNHLNETSFAKLLAGVVHFFYFTERNLEFCEFFLHWLLSVVKVFISVMCSAIKSFVLLSSFSGFNLISLSKQDCLIYFNY